MLLTVLHWFLESLYNASNTTEHIENEADLSLALWRRLSLDFVEQLSALLQLLESFDQWVMGCISDWRCLRLIDQYCRSDWVRSQRVVASVIKVCLIVYSCVTRIIESRSKVPVERFVCKFHQLIVNLLLLKLL